MPDTVVPSNIIALLKLREGSKPYVYADSRGFLTGGVGHKITDKEKAQYPLDAEVSQETADAWLQADSLSSYKAAITQAQIIGVDDPRLIAGLTCVNFQLGSEWPKKFVNTWKLIVSHEWDAAAIEVGNSLWMKQTPTRCIDFQTALRSLDTPLNPAPSV